MDDIRFGTAIRALRRRLGWRQADLARRAGVRQQTVSDIERGRVADVRFATIRQISRALDARALLDLQWRGGALDRLIDRRHAALVEAVARVLVASGWEVQAEVAFAIGAARGSVDLLAWKGGVGAVLIIEVKSELTSVEETLRRLAIKQRLAREITREAAGLTPSVNGTALVLPETSTARRRVVEHATTFASRLPQTGRDLRTWLHAPNRALAAVWFLSTVPMVGGKRGEPAAQRVRTSSASSTMTAGR
jgi:HTH-type transcriptional regulator/antitoxin HipB